MIEGQVQDVKPSSQRLRLKVSMTCHPRTLDMLDAMVEKLGSNRGRIVDRLVATLACSYREGKVHCIDGQVCVVGRVNLPETM